MKKTVALILAVLMLTLTLCACGADENKNLEEVRLGVKAGDEIYSEVFHSLEIKLPELGYKLVYKEFETSAQADEALAKGEIDFSCITKKAEIDERQNDALVEIGPAYYCPYALFLLSYNKEADIKDGAVISIPSDAEGMARALVLLENRGYIKLKEDAGVTATLDDIAENKRGFDIHPVTSDKIADYDADIMVTDAVTATQMGYELPLDSVCMEQDDLITIGHYSTVILTSAANQSSAKMETVKKYLFTRRMFNSIDNSTNCQVKPAFDPK